MDASRHGDEDDNQTPGPPVSATWIYQGFTEGHIALLQHASESFQEGLRHLIAQSIFCPIRGAILWYVRLCDVDWSAAKNGMK